MKMRTSRLRIFGWMNQKKREAPLFCTGLAFACLTWMFSANLRPPQQFSSTLRMRTCVCVGVHTHSVEEQEQEDKKVLEGGEGVFGCFRSAPLYNTGSSSIGSSVDL